MSDQSPTEAAEVVAVNYRLGAVTGHQRHQSQLGDAIDERGEKVLFDGVGFAVLLLQIEHRGPLLRAQKAVALDVKDMDAPGLKALEKPLKLQGCPICGITR